MMYPTIAPTYSGKLLFLKAYIGTNIKAIEMGAHLLALNYIFFSCFPDEWEIPITAVLTNFDSQTVMLVDDLLLNWNWDPTADLEMYLILFFLIITN